MRHHIILWIYLVVAVLTAWKGKFEINRERVRNPLARLLFGLTWPAWMVFTAVLFLYVVASFIVTLCTPRDKRRATLTLTFRGREIWRS